MFTAITVCCTAVINSCGDFRGKLREHFEVNRHYIVVATLKALSEDGLVKSDKVAEAIKKYGIDADKVNPLNA